MSAPEVQPNRVHPRRRPVINDALPTLVTDSFPESSKMQLKKGETFHTRTTPSTGKDPVLNIRSLPRRSPTSLEAITASEQRMASILERLTLDDTPEEPASAAPAQEDLPVPRGVLDARVGPDSPVSTASRRSSMDSSDLPSLWDKKIRHDSGHESDSGLGTSVSSCDVQSTASDSKVNNGIHAEKSALGGSIKSSFELGSSPRRQLALAACKQIERHILVPLLKEEKLKPFHSLVRSVPSRIVKKQIVCLRDLEKTLLWLAPKYATTRSSYLDFSEFTIQCLHSSTPHLNDRDQRLPTDRPYTNGYFLDLVSQVRRYAAMIRASRNEALAAQAYKDSFTPIMFTNPTLEGGLSLNGKPVELVVMKDGQRISMASGQPYSYDNPVTIKRTLSSFNDELGNEGVPGDEGVQRSMARRKKNAPPMDINQKCQHCDKVFKRPCDLTKHEKTHSRPWKCRTANCKYVTIGWPTEKERDRHENDKHSPTPALFKCKFPPCTYASKRESNCKQHMEKAHGWKYNRSKNNSRGGSKRGSSLQATPVTPDLSTPSSKPADFPTPISGSSVSSHDLPFFDDNVLNFNDPPMPAAKVDFNLYDNVNSTGMFDYNLYPTSATLDAFQAQFQAGPPDMLIPYLEMALQPNPSGQSVQSVNSLPTSDLDMGLDWAQLDAMSDEYATNMEDEFATHVKEEFVTDAQPEYATNMPIPMYADGNAKFNAMYPGAQDVPLFSNFTGRY